MTPDDNTPETLLRMALANPEEAHGRYPDYRLTRLVMARFDMDDAEALAFARLTGRAEDRDFKIGPRTFDNHLRRVIGQFGLAPLFTDDGPGLHHHAIRPKGYDYYADQVDPAAMERWRTEYRAMRNGRCSPLRSSGSIAAVRTTAGYGVSLALGMPLAPSLRCSSAAYWARGEP
jgi:hypothetical protein